MLDAKFLDAIKRFEGFAAQARWDYAQHTNGYGTRARAPGEVIDRAEADRRFMAAVTEAAKLVDKVAPNLDEGARAALTSLTYNAGTAWTKGELGRAVTSGDLESAREIFLKYNKAGGEILEGLARRREAEAAWFDTSGAGGSAFALPWNPAAPAAAVAAAAQSGTGQAVAPQSAQFDANAVDAKTAAAVEQLAKLLDAPATESSAKAATSRFGNSEDARTLVLQLLTVLLSDGNASPNRDVPPSAMKIAARI